MSLKGFSLFRSGIGWFDVKKDDAPDNREFSPSVTLQLDKEIYRPGDTIIATIEICSPKISKECLDQGLLAGTSFLVDNLEFEIKGIEKVDSQWFATPKSLPGSKQKKTRGEHLFLDATAPSIVSKVVLSSGSTKTYVVRVDLPKILPPSYRGISIRYIYYVRTAVSGRCLVLENQGSINNPIQVDSRTPLQIWASQKSNNLLNEEGFHFTADQLDIYWKEKDTDSEWVRASEDSEILEDEYDSSKDEVSSVSSYNPIRGQYDATLRNSLSMQSIASRLSTNDFRISQGERSNVPSYMPITQLSVAEVLDDASGVGLMAPQNNLYSSSASFPSQQRDNLGSSFPKGDVVGSPYASKSIEPLTSEGFVRGRSYNIRIDDQVLLRFSPKNSDSTYYFGDTVGGTLTFFHREGVRRCLEVSVTLEISETIAPHLVHPSRRGSSTITKVLSEHHEAVCDLVQTSFLFSIPIDGPMSFSTPKVSVKWSLRFEFFTTKDSNLSRYEHPLLVEHREKGDWVLPLTVYAPPLRAQAAQSRNHKSSSLGGLFNT